MRIRFTKLGYGLFLTGILAIIGACSKNTPGSGDSFLFQGERFRVIGDDSALTQTESVLSGTGTVRAYDAREDRDSNFALKFSLDKGSAITLISNANEELGNGINITFTRDAATDMLRTSFTVGAEGGEITEDLEAVSAADPVSVEVDVHGHGHLIFWFNGGEEAETAFITRPIGTVWGVSLQNAVLTQARAGAPKEQH